MSVSTKLFKMKSRSKLYYLFSCAFLLIKYCDGETMKEKQNREKYCGLPHEKFTQKNGKSIPFPWYVGLRVTIGSEKFYYTGTLISNRYVVTSAAVFEANQGKSQSDWENVENWAALLGAYNIPGLLDYGYRPDPLNLGHYYVADWSEISRFEIHPLYNSILGAFNYNVAVVQLKKKLEFGPDSRYNPICLPRCDHLCRTDSGWLEQDLVGSSVVVSRGTFEQNLEIITNAKCQKLISDKVGSTPVTIQAGLKYYLEGNKIKRLV